MDETGSDNNDARLGKEGDEDADADELPHAAAAGGMENEEEGEEEEEEE